MSYPLYRRGQLACHLPPLGFLAMPLPLVVCPLPVPLPAVDPPRPALPASSPPLLFRPLAGLCAGAGVANLLCAFVLGGLSTKLVSVVRKVSSARSGFDGVFVGDLGLSSAFL